VVLERYEFTRFSGFNSKADSSISMKVELGVGVAFLGSCYSVGGYLYFPILWRFFRKDSQRWITS